MSELYEHFGQAADRFADLVHQVRDDQWGARTPCSDWDVRALVNHLVYEARWAPPLLEGQTIEQVGDRFEGDLLGDDPKTSYDAAIREASAAATTTDPAQTVHLSFGDVPAEDYLTQLTGDFVVHAWDLARGIGADDRLDPELVTFVYDSAEPMADALAASGLFAPRVDVSDDADAQTKLLALFGRRA